VSNQATACPFCGHTGAWPVHFQDPDDSLWDTHCIRCVCGAEGATRNTPALALEAWNRRTSPVQPAVSEEMGPFGWYYEHKNGDCDPELVFERWSDPGRSNYVETQLFARAQSSSKGDEGMQHE